MSTSAKTGGFLLLLGLAAVPTPAQDEPTAHSLTLRNPHLHFLYHHDVSRPLHEMPARVPWTATR